MAQEMKECFGFTREKLKKESSVKLKRRLRLGCIRKGESEKEHNTFRMWMHDELKARGDKLV